MNKKAATQEKIVELCAKEEDYGNYKEFDPTTWLKGWEAAEKFYGINREIPISRHQGIFCPG